MSAPGPLSGLRVVELGEGVAVPFCGRLLADYGAEVVKVERPGTGDVTRSWGPFRDDRPDPEASGLFIVLNAGKQSIALDAVGDRDELAELVASAHVLVTSQAPSVLRSWQLDPAQLTARHPGLVNVSITPYGATGPYAEWRGYDLNAFHLSGAGWRYCGRPGEEPLEQGTFAADYFGAFVAAGWTVAAAEHRARTGVGQVLDVSCVQVLAGLFTGAQNAGPFAATGRYECRTGVGMLLGAPAAMFPASDGFVWILALEPDQWIGLRRAMGDPEWAQSELFDDMLARAVNRDVLYPLITEWTMGLPKQHIMDVCQANRCPTTAVYDVAEISALAHLEARGAFVELDQPRTGRLRVPAAPVRLSGVDRGPRVPAPRLDEHALAERWPAASHDQPTVAGTDRTPPLAGLRVANFGHGWVGPAAGQVLAWLGADVVKIESRARVDLQRTLRPFAGDIIDPDRSIQNHSTYAGNGSLALDLKTPRGVELAKRFVAECDVVLENFAPGVMDRLGLGYDELSRIRPSVVMVSCPAAGSSGPLAGVRTYGMSLASITGLDSVTGYRNEPPIPFENAFADPLGGTIAAFATLLGLAHRRRTGEGQHIDCSQQEAMLPFMGPALVDFALNRRVGGPLGNGHPTAAGAPHGVFRCRGDDQWVSIAVLDDEAWRGLVDAMGRPAWALDDTFASADGRVAGIDRMHRALSDWTADRDNREVAQLLQAHGVAAAPVLDIPGLLTDPHLRARRTFVEVTHPLGFDEVISGPYVHASGFDIDLVPGPVIGRDNERILVDLLGLDPDEYVALVERKVVH